jgi:predicted dehydrogenase
MEEVECYGVASRSLEKAESFAREYGFAKAYGSYEELIKDEEVELVYIATPHSLHYEHMMLAISYGKPVLCEKAFTMNASQAQEIRDYAHVKGVFVAEALWTRYMPSRALINKVLDSGVIGKANILTGNLSYIISHKERIMAPSLTGGALLDVGVYGLNFALMHFGNEIDRIESSVQLTETGVDGMETITILYRDGRMAVLTHGIYSRSDRQGIIYGDKGYMIVENINNPQSIRVYDSDDRLIESHQIPNQISGYEYEFREAIRCIEAGKLQSDWMSLEDSIELMKIMDGPRKQWGVQYPKEKW